MVLANFDVVALFWNLSLTSKFLLVQINEGCCIHHWNMARTDATFLSMVCHNNCNALQSPFLLEACNFANEATTTQNRQPAEEWMMATTLLPLLLQHATVLSNLPQ